MPIAMIFVSIVVITLNIEAKFVSFYKTKQPPSIQENGGGITFKTITAKSVMLDIDLQGMVITSDKIGGTLYSKIELEGFTSIQEVGKPYIPSSSFYMAVPLNSQMKATVVKQESLLYNTYTLTPVLRSKLNQPLVKDVKADELIDSSVYKSDSFYPSSLVTLQNTQLLRQIPITQIRVCPVQYNPSKNVVKVYKKLSIKIEFVGGTIQDIGKGPFEELFRSTVINAAAYQSASPAHASTKTTINGFSDFLIVTVDSLKAAAESLASWKSAQSYVTKIESQPTWTSSLDVATAIRRFYLENNRPSYVLLLGDKRVIPSEKVTDKISTDFFYSCMDGTQDSIADMYMGRIPASSAASALSIMKKVLNYQRDYVPDELYYKKSVSRLIDKHTISKELLQGDTASFVGMVAAFDPSMTRAIDILNKLIGESVLPKPSTAKVQKYGNLKPQNQPRLTVGPSGLIYGLMRIRQIVPQTSQLSLMFEWYGDPSMELKPEPPKIPQSVVASLPEENDKKSAQTTVRASVPVKTIEMNQSTVYLMKIQDLDPSKKSENCEIVDKPLNGTIDTRLEKIMYTPRSEYCGVDSFSYRLKSFDGTYSEKVWVKAFIKSQMSDADIAFPSEPELNSSQAEAAIYQDMQQQTIYREPMEVAASYEKPTHESTLLQDIQVTTIPKAVQLPIDQTVTVVVSNIKNIVSMRCIIVDPRNRSVFQIDIPEPSNVFVCDLRGKIGESLTGGSYHVLVSCIDNRGGVSNHKILLPVIGIQSAH